MLLSILLLSALSSDVVAAGPNLDNEVKSSVECYCDKQIAGLAQTKKSYGQNYHISLRLCLGLCAGGNCILQGVEVATDYGYQRVEASDPYGDGNYKFYYNGEMYYFTY